VYNNYYSKSGLVNTTTHSTSTPTNYYSLTSTKDELGAIPGEIILHNFLKPLLSRLTYRGQSGFINQTESVKMLQTEIVQDLAKTVRTILDEVCGRTVHSVAQYEVGMPITASMDVNTSATTNIDDSMDKVSSKKVCLMSTIAA